MKKLSARWAPRLLTVDHKRERVTISKQYLEMFQRNPDEFLRRVITVDETWIHYFTPETKEQSKQWKQCTLVLSTNLKNQIMTTNLWVEQIEMCDIVTSILCSQSWYDYKLKWDPKEYGGVEMLHVPSDHIWRPDIVLYNNADGNFEVTLATKATLNYTGRVEWKPPAIYKSSCEIDVEYFPFDEQTCVMKFGSWTYDGFQVDLRHIDEVRGSNVVDIGVDLSEFYTSVEWDILEVPAVRNEKFYTCCDEPYLDITFNITMRRKTLFYTVNLIIPCMGISFLTVLVFYLPSDSGEKVSLSISILLSLTVFFLLLAEIIPPTSLVVPLLGKFVLFTMILDTFSICVTVVVLNVHFRSPQTHVMSPWVRRVFIHVLPRLLVMRRQDIFFWHLWPGHWNHARAGIRALISVSRARDISVAPQYQLEKRAMGGHHGHRVMVRTCNGLELRDPSPFVESSASELVESSVLFPSVDSRDELHPRELEAVNLGSTCRIHGSPAATAAPPPQLPTQESVDALCNTLHHWHHCPELYKAIEGIRFIADHTKREEDSTRVKEDWKYVAMVLDRLFLWIFTLAVVVGTAGIILQAPTLYDDRIPIDVRLSEIASTTAKPHIVTSL
ncbi:Acetylcholine receptor subunit alpha-like protein [Cyphomyrmex costatus]|uniref:Acetylcholine receptor subunit alpha-like protein n=1 Tax=Cyphomyrmex costatus TaxID=456900 RepID=A0A195CT10_9HYME|nr:Acetylcholine receptor subunit alpha-like protein [Cyphomyrmex costatus]